MANIALFTSNSANLARKICCLRDDIKLLVLPKHSDNKFNIPYCVYDENTLSVLTLFDISHVMLVGFPQLVSHTIINKYRGKIWNTHPGNVANTLGLIGPSVYQRMIDDGTLTTNISVLEVGYGLEDGEILKTAEFPISNIADIKGELVDNIEPWFVNDFLNETIQK